VHGDIRPRQKLGNIEEKAIKRRLHGRRNGVVIRMGCRIYPGPKEVTQSPVKIRIRGFKNPEKKEVKNVEKYCGYEE